MKKTFMRFPVSALILIFALAVFSLVGCNTTTTTTTATTEPTVPVTGVVLDQEEVTLEEGESVTLVATIVPSNATEKGVVWSTDDAEVATVDQNGLVTAVVGGAGASATITATTVDGSKVATCGIIVIEALGEPITFSVANGSFTSTLTLYPAGVIELTGAAVLNTTELEIQPFSGSFTVTDNQLTILGSLYTVAFGNAFAFNVLNEMSFINQELILRLYVNNGTSDFELGTFTLSKEDAAYIGIDTTVPVVLVTGTSQLLDSVELWTDGKVVVHAVALAAVVGEVNFETTWTQVDDVITIAMKPAVTTNFGPFNMYCFVTVAGTGIQIAVTADNTSGGDPHTGLVLATVLISREDALSKLGIEIPYKAVTAVVWDDDNITERTNPLDPEDKWMAIDMISGTSLDLSTVAAFTPTDATATAFETVVSSEAKVVFADDNIIYAVQAGTSVITATVDGVSIELTVNVAYPENTYVDPVAFAQVTRFEMALAMGSLNLVFDFDFFTDGMVYVTQYANGALFGSTMGYYNVTKTADVVTSISIDLFNSATEMVVPVTITSGVMSFTDTDSNVYTQVVYEGAFATQQTFHGQIDLTPFGGAVMGFNIVFATDGTLVYSTTYAGFPLGSVNGIYALDGTSISILLDSAKGDINGDFTVVTGEDTYLSIVLSAFLTVSNKPVE